MSIPANKKFSDILLEEQYLTKKQLNMALDIAKTSNKKLDEILIEDEIVSEEDIIEILSLQMGIPRVKLNGMYLSAEIVELVPEYYARKYTAFPVKKDGSTLMIALSDPRDIVAIDDIRMATGFDLQIVIATKVEIQKAIEIYYGKSDNLMAIHEKDEFLARYNEENLDKVPAVSIVNTLIYQAVKKRASDIHIEPQEKSVLIRYRIDGMLSKIMTFSKKQLMSVTARIKIMSNLDITTQRLPQDGRLKMNIENQTIDIRVSIIPTINGEKVVLRLLNRSEHLLNLDQLGFNKVQEEYLHKMLNIPYGMILVTGPAGSGKTTTLYSMLNNINTSTKNITTLEDPVEYAIPGINQIQINQRAGITFAKGLRAVLRQDPNVIMIGEIRDRDTAEIAIRAALTGHLVFSTLHTNNASGAINRLLDMGVESYLLASCLVGVISQRLVRKICPRCIEEDTLSEEGKLVGIRDGVRMFRGKGCSLCNYTGFSGRTAVGEIIIIHQKHRESISNKASSSQLDKISKELGYVNLIDNGMDLVKNGVISFGELLRVFYRE